MAEKEIESSENTPEKPAPQAPRRRSRRAEARSLLSRLTANWFTMGGSVVIVTAFVIYFPLKEVGKNLAEFRDVPPAAAMTMPAVLLTILGLVLLSRVLSR